MAVLAAILAPAATAAEPTLPSGFKDETVLQGLNQPTIVKFAPNGEVFVAEKGGKILVYQSLQDTEPEIFADLSKAVYDFEDHGLLGLAIDPLFDLGRPYVYALYTFNHELADPETQQPLVSDPLAVTPKWPPKGPGYENDECPEGEEAKKHEIPKELEGCEVSGVLVRLTAEGDHASPEASEPAEKVLLEGWCQQSTTHSIGEVGFGPEGNLFVSGGEGAMYSEPDYGQFGNLCKDPPEWLNPNPERATAEGGSLRAQSFLRPHYESKHATLLSGTVLRVNPDSGEGVAGNPFISSSEANARRIIGFGFRQPWRFTFDKVSNSLYVDNVGNGAYEEIERLPIGASRTYNGGWPCYEGPARNLEYAGQPAPSINICIHQYEQEDRGEPQTSTPFFAYAHSGRVSPDDGCYKESHFPTDIAGNAIYEGSGYPSEYKRALFFADAIRGCIYVMRAGANGEPDPATVSTFMVNHEPFSFPGVDLEAGPEGNLFYVQLSGTVHRITFQRSTTPEEPKPTPTPQPSPHSYKQPKIRRHPAKKTTKRSARFVFEAEAGLRFRCKLDGKHYSSCRSPRVYRHLKPGKHSFRVQALDSSGNPVTKVTVFKWRILPG